MKARRMKM
jgi:hypothetical protein